MALEVYAVKSHDGKYYRTKGYMGTGLCWVDTLEKARVWFKISPAKAIVSYWTINHPTFTPPNLVKFTIGAEQVISTNKDEIMARHYRREINWRRRNMQYQQSQNGNTVTIQKEVDELTRKLVALKI